MRFVNTKNMCFLVGIIFGFSMYFYNLFFIPSVVLLIIGGIQTFEISIKKKKCIEEHLNFKLNSYEQENILLKKEFDKVKADLDSLKVRINITQVYGSK